MQNNAHIGTSTSCSICSRPVDPLDSRLKRGRDGVHCVDCSKRVNTFKNVISDVEKVDDGMRFNPAFLRRIPTKNNVDSSLTLAGNFGELDWNLADGPTFAEEELKNKNFPRHIPEESKSFGPFVPFAHSTPAKFNKNTNRNAVQQIITVPSGSSKREEHNNKQRSRMVLIKTASGKEELLEEVEPGKYVKCLNPQIKQQIQTAVTTQKNIALQKTTKLTPAIVSQSSEPRKIEIPILSKVNHRSLVPNLIGKVSQNSKDIQDQSSKFIHKHKVSETSDQQDPHRESVSSSSCIVCPECNCKLQSRESLHNHIKDKHLDFNGFSCCYCVKRFDSLSALISHKLNNHRTQIGIMCHVCGSEFRNESLFLDHISNQPTPKFETFKCECGRQFASRVGLLGHQEKTNHGKTEIIRQTTEPIPKIVNVTSGLKGPDPGGLIPEHDLGLVTTGTIKCPICPGLLFAHEKYLNFHIEIRHSNESVLPCFCGDKFRTLTQLVSHHSTAHAKEYGWICEYCGISFPKHQESAYCTHLNNHSIVTHDCRCGQQFASEKALEEHGLKMHSTLKLYKCFPNSEKDFRKASGDDVPTAKDTPQVIEKAPSSSSDDITQSTTPEPPVLEPEFNLASTSRFSYTKKKISLKRQEPQVKDTKITKAVTNDLNEKAQLASPVPSPVKGMKRKRPGPAKSTTRKVTRNVEQQNPPAVEAISARRSSRLRKPKIKD